MGHLNFYLDDIAKFRNGNDNAIESVWERMYPLVVKQIKGILPGLYINDVLFEELLANCRIKVWRCMQLFNSEKNRNFLTYAMTAVRNVIIDVLRLELPERINRFVIDANGNNTEFTDDILYKRLDNSIAWFWIPATDAKILKKEIINTVAKELTGRSFIIFLLKRVGRTDDEIRRKLGVSIKEYQKILKLFNWRISYIVKKYQFDLV